MLDGLPTYAEIASGTAKRRWIFELSSEDAAPESVLVRLRGLSWNQIEETIMPWKELSIELLLQTGTCSDVATSPLRPGAPLTLPATVVALGDAHPHSKVQRQTTGERKPRRDDEYDRYVGSRRSNGRVQWLGPAKVMTRPRLR